MKEREISNWQRARVCSSIDDLVFELFFVPSFSLSFFEDMVVLRFVHISEVL